MADIKHSIQIAATPSALQSQIATARGFRQWWAEDVSETGDTVELAFFNRTTIYRLRLTANAPPGAAEWVCETGNEWVGTRIVFHPEAMKAGTLLRFRHSGWPAESDYFMSCNTTWGELMFRLKAAAEGKTPGPLFSRDGMAY
jgi:hypothetical protein